MVRFTSTKNKMNADQIYNHATDENADGLFASIEDALSSDPTLIDTDLGAALEKLAGLYERGEYSDEEFCEEVVICIETLNQPLQ